eukprot:15342402-Ditylum_brightwellii.AAC.1
MESVARSSTNYMKMTDNPSDVDAIKASHPSTSKKNTLSSRKVWIRVNQSERDELLRFLGDETKRAADFYRARLAALTRSTAELKKGFVPDPSGGYYAGGSPFYLANEILELFAFVTINVVVVRQILIRFDAFVRTFGGTPVSQWYYKKARSSSKSSKSFQVTGWFWYLLCHVELRDLALNFEDIVRAVYPYDEEDGQGTIFPMGSDVGAYSPPTPLCSDPDADFATIFTQRKDMFKHILSKTHRSATKAANGHFTRRDNFAHTVRDWFLSGDISNNLGLQPKFLNLRGKSLDREMKVIADWRENKDNAPQHSDAWSVFSENAFITMSWKVAFPLGLNLMTICFFMMNYYIVEPSSTTYVNALGCSDAMSGLLIGALPWAMLISMIVYSYWTNYSFRKPILISGVLLITGNILYALAYSYKSIYMALAG